ncbi:DNA-binding protein [Bifidobacterium margollesii]|uniref:DNA-binding protein n=1 Tax=Bifidobacterium margollesii TaxID=2020964 RepID=A0A2N5JB49_9BIFI|nr:DNA-binding protein [Bifidobacterium margollesii]PLS31411.1 DNA-binding protein [Bifidobacterium margollesii]
MTTIDSDPTAVRTLTIRKVPVECVDVLKQAARENNRSMESQVKSVLEEWTAGYVAHEEAKSTNFAQEMRNFMSEMGIAGFDDEEFSVPDRRTEMSRDVSFDDWRDTGDAGSRSIERGTSV